MSLLIEVSFELVLDGICDMNVQVFIFLNTPGLEILRCIEQ